MIGGSRGITSINGIFPVTVTGSNTFTPSFATSDATVAFSAASITVPAGGTVSVDVTMTGPTGPVALGNTVSVTANFAVVGESVQKWLVWIAAVVCRPS